MQVLTLGLADEFEMDGELELEIRQHALKNQKVARGVPMTVEDSA